MNDTLFLQHCDPRQDFNAKQVLALINLHALLLNEVVIQDSFLISNLFYNIYKISPENSFPNLFSEKILNIASRNTLDHSILNLKDDLLIKSQKDLYIPFEGKSIGLELYKDRNFLDYLKSIDRQTTKRKSELRDWSPNHLGLNLRKLMYESAINNSPNMEGNRAIEIFHEIDNLVMSNGGQHSRSLYYNYIHRLGDDNEKVKLKTWINLMYIKNLPDSLSIGISIPSRQLTNEFNHNHISRFETRSSFNDLNILGEIDGTLLNIDFLANLHPESLLQLRKLTEFTELQRSMEEDSELELTKHLTIYLKRISEEAPKYYEPYRKKIRRLESLKKGKTLLADALDCYNIITLEPISGKIAGILSFVLKKVKNFDSRIKKTITLSETELSSNESLVKNLGEVIHKVE